MEMGNLLRREEAADRVVRSSKRCAIPATIALVMPRAPFKREDRPPDTERDPRPNARVPADEEDIWRIGTHHALQIPWTHDNDAQAHRSRPLPRKGSCDGGKCEHDRAVGHVTRNQLLDNHRGKPRLLDLHKQLESRLRKKR